MSYKQQITKSKTGFTIIEVVLVLAIAGLIFLMVFVALPALQRSQRDTQRRQDIAGVATAVTQFQANNNGELPSNGNDFRDAYLKVSGATFKDPDGADYSIVLKPNTNADKYPKSFNHEIWLVKTAYCDGEKFASTNATARNYAILYKLEGAGVYCVDNK